MVDHVAPQFVENSESDDFAYSRWSKTDEAGVAAHTVPPGDDRVLVLHPAEPPLLCFAPAVTRGEKQVQTKMGTTFDPQGCTLVSAHFLLAAERALYRQYLTSQKQTD